MLIAAAPEELAPGQVRHPGGGAVRDAAGVDREGTVDSLGDRRKF